MTKPTPITAPITRAFAQVRYQQQPINIHYRLVKSGECKESGKRQDNQATDDEISTVLMLHPSPLSSKFMTPIMMHLSASLNDESSPNQSSLVAQGFDVIAWDAPGYGDSDKLPQTNETLEPYVECLKLFIEANNLKNVILYGNATGAQIAIAFGKKYPELVERLLLENVAIFSDQERKEMMASYFPDLTPNASGDHLSTTWHMVQRLFTSFPWYDKSPSAQLETTLPPLEFLQSTFDDYLKAGATYADAYKAAMTNETPLQFVDLTVPTDILVWQDSIIAKYCARLSALVLSEHIQLHHAGKGMPARLALLERLAINLRTQQQTADHLGKDK